MKIKLHLVFDFGKQLLRNNLQEQRKYLTWVKFCTLQLSRRVKTKTAKSDYPDWRFFCCADSEAAEAKQGTVVTSMESDPKWE